MTTSPEHPDHTLSHTSYTCNVTSDQWTRCERSTHEGSLFHDLPVELLFSIGLHASGLTLSVLFQVCRKFRQTFGELGDRLWVEDFKTTFRYNQPYFDGQDLTQYYLLLKRDAVRRNYGHGSDPPQTSELFCSSCSSTHSRHSFSEQQISLPAHKRMCTEALTGGIQTCPHLVMPFFAVQSLRLSHPEAEGLPTPLSGQHADAALECPTAQGLYFCTDTRRRELLHPTLGFDTNPPCAAEPIRYSEPFTYKLVSQYSILRYRDTSTLNLTVRALAERLERSAGMVCSHLAMRSLEVLCSAWKAAHRLAIPGSLMVCWLSCKQSGLAATAPFRASKICSCRHTDCNTKWRFLLDFRKREREVYLIVQRDVGKLESANDPKWLSQRTVPLGLLP